MTDYIKLPRAMLTDNLWRDGNLARLYLYLLAKTDEAVSFRGIANDTGLSVREVRTALSKLQKAGIVTQVATQSTTQVATQVTLCGIGNKAKPTTQVATQSTTQVATQADATSKDGFERFREYFNTSVSGTSIPQISKLTDSRKNALRSIFKEYGKDAVEKVIQKTLASDFLSREWGKVSFDWIFKKSNFIKILEGNYDNKPAGAATSAKESRDRLRCLATEIVSRSTNLINLFNGG